MAPLNLSSCSACPTPCPRPTLSQPSRTQGVGGQSPGAGGQLTSASPKQRFPAALPGAPEESLSQRWTGEHAGKRDPVHRAQATFPSLRLCLLQVCSVGCFSTARTPCRLLQSKLSIRTLPQKALSESTPCQRIKSTLIETQLKLAEWQSKQTFPNFICPNTESFS